MKVSINAPILHVLLFACMTLYLANTASAADASKPIQARTSSKQYALLIGIAQYEDKTIAAIKDADNSIDAMQKCLVGLGYDAKHITALTSKADKTSASYVTQANIVKALSDILHKIKSDETLLIYFTGRGFLLDNNYHFVTADTDTKSDETLKATALPLTRLRDRMLDSPLHQVIILSNTSCSLLDSGRTSSKGLHNDLLPQHPENSDLQIGLLSINATGIPLGIRDSAWHGRLDDAIVRGLQGKAADDKGVILLSRLHQFLRGELEGINKYPARSWEQTYITLNANDVYLGKLGRSVLER